VEPAHLEKTIASVIEFSGIGLHSGAPVNMRLLPAPAGSGIVFRRTDLDNYEIAATGRNVAKVSYATSIMRQGVLISTTEHLLSALIGMGVDNVIIELDNLELPILDGSALPYVEAFAEVGIRSQRRRRQYLRILKSVEVRENGKFIAVYPGEGYSITYDIHFPHPIGRQAFTVDLAAGAYGAQIAAARTFGFREDEKMLRDMGLIRGASEENAIILCGGTVALAGHRILGRVVAQRAGHAMHTALVSRLLRDRSAWELVQFPAPRRTIVPVHAPRLATA
jgi:UDP-3-O-[3-hydroxymyristoyl] N-acetylglucosamine deacetylase